MTDWEKWPRNRPITNRAGLEAQRILLAAYEEQSEKPGLSDELRAHFRSEATVHRTLILDAEARLG